MNPDTRFAASLALSLALSIPNLLGVIAGTADIVSVGLRYLAAFAVAYFGVGVVGRLYNSYLAAREERIAEALKSEIEELEAEAAREARRRSDDSVDAD